MENNKEKIQYILQFFFDKGENASLVTEIVNGVYGADTVTANYMQFWFVNSVQKLEFYDIHRDNQSLRSLMEPVFLVERYQQGAHGWSSENSQSPGDQSRGFSTADSHWLGTRACDQSTLPIDVQVFHCKARDPHVEAWRVGRHLSCPPRHSTEVPNHMVYERRVRYSSDSKKEYCMKKICSKS
ncbi:uncharacterized protein TNCV_2979961 [Trichonephila clavipes]|nr:uncharacterized protein TNCV_2979961 [Trichonephila clavipes]